MNNWLEDGRELLFSLRPFAVEINNNMCKKYRSHHENDVRHKDKLLKQRRKKNKNNKTHKKK